MRQRVQHRQLHARHAELRQHAAVDELDERVHDALRMHDDLDPIVRQPEQKVCLDHLERLVGERRAVDGDLSSHPPGRMLQRVGERRAARAAPAVHWRNGPPDAVRIDASHLDARAAGDALQDRAVLAVDRHDLAAAARARGASTSAPRHDERFLVRERDALAALERGERRVETRRADDGVEHDVDVVARRRVDEAVARRTASSPCSLAPLRTSPTNAGCELARLLARAARRC